MYCFIYMLMIQNSDSANDDDNQRDNDFFSVNNEDIEHENTET